MIKTRVIEQDSELHFAVKGKVMAYSKQGVGMI